MDYSKYENKFSFTVIGTLGLTAAVAHMADRRKEERRLTQAFKKDALCELGLELHSKGERLFEIAYANRHSEGLSAVMDEMEELSDLLS